MRERAANQGSRRERGQNEGGGNTARRRQKMRGYLLMGTRATDGGGRKNHGKPASPPTELGANKTSYASAKIGDQRRSLRRCLGETRTAPTPRPQRGQPHVDGPPRVAFPIPRPLAVVDYWCRCFFLRTLGSAWSGMSPSRRPQRRSSQATSWFDGITAHRCLCVRTGSGTPEKHTPIPERCPRQEPLGRNRSTAFTLCYKVSGLSAPPSAL